MNLKKILQEAEVKNERYRAVCDSKKGHFTDTWKSYAEAVDEKEKHLNKYPDHDIWIEASIKYKIKDKRQKTKSNNS